jgi:glutamate-1-semialdehyde 2,1-aminomutase
MDLCTNRIVVGAGTFNGYPLGVRAALTTINILEKDKGAFYKERERIQKKLTDGLKGIAKRYDQTMLLQENLGVVFFQFIDKEVCWNMGDWINDADHKKQEKFRQQLFSEGVLILFRGRWFMSGGLTDKDVERTLETVDKVMKDIDN